MNFRARNIYRPGSSFTLPSIVGSAVSFTVGSLVGFISGCCCCVGPTVGSNVGSTIGVKVGRSDGSEITFKEGETVRSAVIVKGAFIGVADIGSVVGP